MPGSFKKLKNAIKLFQIEILFLEIKPGKKLYNMRKNQFGYIPPNYIL